MFQGSLVAMVTPMHPDTGVDLPAMERLIDFHVDNGTQGIISVGTTGESATLGFDLHGEVMEKTVKHAAGRLPVIAGTGGNSTAEAIHLTRIAREIGADGALLVVPYYNKPTQEGLYQHFKLIAETVPIPQILYNVPGRTGCDMLTATVDRLADIDNIVAIKDATGDLDRARELVETCGDRIDILTGEDGSACEHMLLGGKGDISVTANVAPRAMRQLCDAGLAGDAETARRINGDLEDLHAALFLESNPIPVKWALHEMGMIERGIRLPMTWLSERYHESVRAAMRKAGII
ncbi:MAG: 4-hydroxy-tetrahydrodipicolinate synthase [Gammaproteobacteria bacterium]|nr:4-hydroxy-tetrahydrodipicolinate synthase [Gammaproteobacteria bacterium]